MKFRLGLLCLAALASALILQGCIMLPPFGFGENRGRMYPETIEPPDRIWTRHEIVLIPIEGTIETGGTRVRQSELDSLVALKDRLKTAGENPRIKAVILRINSPGGDVTAADLMYREILRFKKKKDVPVIVQMNDLAASGGLYVAMAGDEVYALPTTITGSIGVITLLPSLKGLTDKIGVEMRIIKSGQNKDIGSPWSALNPEQRQIFQGLIDKYYQLFLKAILDGRQKKGLTAEQLKPLADGRVFDAETAKANGLIDGIAYPQEVIDKAKAAAKIKDARIISYEYPFVYRGNIYAQYQGGIPQAGQSGGDVNLLKLDLGGMESLGQGPRFMYLCLP